MLLAIDIGNTTTKFGVFDNENLISRFVIPTIRTNTAAELNDSIRSNLTQTIQAVVIASVVPELEESYQTFTGNRFNINPLFVNHALDFGFRIDYQPPENLGIDRAVAAFAAREKYGRPCLVCDFGTATTIDAVDENGVFIGGIITAGINLLADSLHQRTSKLPKIELVKPLRVIGNSTLTAIQSGVFFGYIGLVEGLLEKMRAETGDNPQVVATGGFARLIASGTQKIEILDENLILEGLRLIYQKILEP